MYSKHVAINYSGLWTAKSHQGRYLMAFKPLSLFPFWVFIQPNPERNLFCRSPGKIGVLFPFFTWVLLVPLSLANKSWIPILVFLLVWHCFWFPRTFVSHCPMSWLNWEGEKLDLALFSSYSSLLPTPLLKMSFLWGSQALKKMNCVCFIL